MTRLVRLAAILVLALSAGTPTTPQKTEERSGLRWTHLSSSTGELPVPGPSTEQTGAVVADLDKSGSNGFVLSFRKIAPALVWYRHAGPGWERSVIDPSFLTVEAGGAVHDIDGDGYPDLVFGADWQGDQVWWWENPAGNYDPSVPWKRHIIKRGGGRQHHDQVFGDFLGTGKPQLVFWNQGAKKLLIAQLPAEPRQAEQWAWQEIFSAKAGEGPSKYAEGLAAIDVDGDGRLDVLAGNYWFKHVGNGQFKATRIADFGGRIAAAHLIQGSKYPQIVINSGDGVGPLKWYECTGDPSNTSDWVGHDLAGRPVVHGHSLQIADIDGDGHLDIFAAEMAKWTEKRSDPDNPNATAWIFFGDGKGHFRKTEFARGIGFHEARVADLNGDGLMDVLNKPYNWQTPRVDVWLQEKTATAAARERRLTMLADGDAGQINVGLQLYSLRAQIPKDVPGTLKRIHDMGITDVEVAGFYDKTAAEFRQQLDKAGLHASGAHFPWNDFSHNIDQVITHAKTIGAEYVTLPWIPHVGRFTEENAHLAATKFNEWGRKCKDAGLRFTYHVHGYEFTKSGDGTVFDQLVKETDPELANFELDIFWAYHGGANPVKLIQKYPTRFVQMHLKDMRKSVKVPQSTGQENVENNVAMGTGQLDLPAIFKEAKKVGVKHYYIEDESSRSLDQIPQSIKYVRSLGF
jgi:sugar phosphate isomerase/epimerase